MILVVRLFLFSILLAGVTVSAMPQSTQLVPEHDGYCPGEDGVRIGILNGDPDVDYLLYFNGEVINTIKVTGSGVFYVAGVYKSGDYDLRDDDDPTTVIDQIKIIEYPLPDAVIQVDHTEICRGHVVELRAQHVGVGGSYSWSPGQDLNGQIVEVRLFQSQQYRLTVTNNKGCQSVDEVNITVNPLPETYLLEVPGQSSAPYCTPLSLRLNGSELGVNYTLLRDGVALPGETLPGNNGAPLEFGEQHTGGVYTVLAENIATECTAMMSGSITVVAGPAEFSSTPSGTLCEGVALGLDGSEIGVSYSLYRTVEGVESFFDGPVPRGESAFQFGRAALHGTYRVYAKNQQGCDVFYSDIIMVEKAPDVVSLLGPYNRCSGSEIILGSSQPEVDYYLHYASFDKADKALIEGPVTGGGGPVNFGPRYAAGTYTVKARNSAACQVDMDGAITIYAKPDIFQLLPDVGQSCEPLAIRLGNSQPGVSYTLLRDGVHLSSLNGNGAALNFGVQSIPGTYHITASFDHGDGLVCMADMTGTLEILQAPARFTLRPVEDRCSPVAFRLDATEDGVEYSLYYGTAAIPLESITGDGSAIVFSEVALPGNYHVVATNGNCSSKMTGIREVLPLPVAYNVTPGGISCSDENPVIGLDESEEGVSYILKRGNVVMGSPVSGNGGAINFGAQSIAGMYTIVAENITSGCQQVMLGQSVIAKSPSAFQMTVNGLVTEQVQCPDKTIGLNGSEPGIRYILEIPDGSTVDFVGTGVPFSFSGSFSVPGEYRVVAETAANCTSMMNGTVVMDVPTSFTLTPVGSVFYCAGDDQAITLRLQGSEPGVRYQLYKNGSMPVFGEKAGDGLALEWTNVSQYGEGTYIVKAYYPGDPNCLFEMGPEIAVTESYNNVVVEATTDVCLGESTTLVATAPDGSFSWSNEWGVVIGSGSSIDVTPSETTSYTVINTNQYGCQASDQVEVVVLSLPVVSLASDPTPAVICTGESVEFFANAQGNGHLTYQWMAGGVPIEGAGSTPYHTANTVGGYSVMVTDINNCQKLSDPIQITLHEIPAVEIVADGVATICQGEHVRLSTTVSGIASFVWLRNNIVITGQTLSYIEASQSGTYRLEAFTINGCKTVSNEISVVVNALPSVSLTTDGAPTTICEGQSVEVTAVVQGGLPSYSFEWYRDGTLVSVPGSALTYGVSASGQYTVLVTDGNACSRQSQPLDVVVMEVQDVVIAAATDTNICYGDHVLLQSNLSSVYSYRWYKQDMPVAAQTAASMNATQEGTYFLEVVYNNGCKTRSNSIGVVVHELPVVNAGDDQTICLNDQVALTATSNITNVTFQWNHGLPNGQAFTPATAGLKNYEVFVTDNQTRCVASDRVSVFVNPLPVLMTGDDVFVCYGEHVTLKANSAHATLVWSHGVEDGVAFIPQASASYVVTATNLSGCSSSDQVNVVVNPLPSVVAKKNAPFVCRGESINLHAVGGVQYFWSHDAGNTASISVSPTEETTYIVNVIDANGCVSSDSITVPVYPLLNAGDDQFICDGGVVTLLARGGVNYQWSHGVTNGVPFTPSNTETYIVSTTDVYGCKGSDEVTVYVHPLPRVRATADKESLCVGEKLTLRGEGGVHYSWSHEVQQNVAFFPTSTETYTVWVYDANNCSASDQITVEVHPLPEVTIKNHDKITCSNPVVVLEANKNPNTTVLWSTESRSQSIVIREPGEYSLVATSEHGCQSQAYTSVEEDLTYPVVEITGNEQLSCHIPYVLLEANHDVEVQGVSYRWSTGANKAFIQVTRPGSFFVDVSGANGCTSRATVFVDQDIEIRDPFVPNAFRPDSDIEENRIFMPDFYCPPYNYRLQIFNRFGARIFEAKDPALGWNGKQDGRNAFPDSYVYQINYDDNEGRPREISGVLMLLR